jgi:hypothetical protein
MANAITAVPRPDSDQTSLTVTVPVSATVKVARVARTSSLPPRPAGSVPPPVLNSSVPPPFPSNPVPPPRARSVPPPLPKVAPPPRRPSFEAREEARVVARVAINDALATLQGVMENLRAKLAEIERAAPPEEATHVVASPAPRASTPPPAALPSAASTPPPALVPATFESASPSVAALATNALVPVDIDVPFRDPHRRAKVLGAILAVGLLALLLITRMA